MYKKSLLLFLVGMLISSVVAIADQPQPWQMGFQQAATPVMERILELHNLVLIIISGVAVLVTSLLAIILFRFRASKNPVPSKRAHNPMLEVVWTIVPLLILLGIAIPSFKLMFYVDKTPNPEMTVKVVANMWFWNYSYPEHEIGFDSNIILDDELKPGQLRLFEVDNQIVIPVNTNIRLLFTSVDVIHSWAVPSFGIKRDCVPGRLSEAWVKVNKEGTYYGQCSELCGMKHGFMPISVRVISKEAFKQWTEQAKEKFAATTTIFERTSHG